MKLFSILLILYLSCGACVPMFDYSQLFKISDLIDHYDLHQKEANFYGKSVSFFDFMAIHYFNYDGHDHDGEKHHEDSPFQSNYIVTTFYCLSSYWVEISRTKYLHQTTPRYYHEYNPTDFIKSIFHPPNIV